MLLLPIPSWDPHVKINLAAGGLMFYVRALGLYMHVIVVWLRLNAIWTGLIFFRRNFFLQFHAVFCMTQGREGEEEPSVKTVSPLSGCITCISGETQCRFDTRSKKLKYEIFNFVYWESNPKPCYTRLRPFTTTGHTPELRLLKRQFKINKIFPSHPIKPGPTSVSAIFVIKIFNNT